MQHLVLVHCLIPITEAAICLSIRTEQSVLIKYILYYVYYLHKLVTLDGEASRQSISRNSILIKWRDPVEGTINGMQIQKVSVIPCCGCRWGVRAGAHRDAVKLQHQRSGAGGIFLAIFARLPGCRKGPAHR